MRKTWKAALAVAAITVLSIQATPVAAEARRTPAQIAAERKDVEAGIAWIDYMLSRADRGDLIVSTRAEDDPDFTSFDLFLPVNRDDLIRTAQRLVFKGEMSAAEAAELMIVLGRQSGKKIRALRAEREWYVARRAELARLASAPPPARPPLLPWELGRPPAASAPESAAECVAQGVWSNVATDRGSSTWTIDADGTAVESGMGGARGKGSVTGGTLTIDWRTGGVAGTYSIDLAADCSGGEGTLSFSDGPPGFDRSSGKAVFTRVGGPS
ncbi:MAG: hypothetical protein ACOY4K_07750 [Pseudomonadota bacterium]